MTPTAYVISNGEGTIFEEGVALSYGEASERFDHYTIDKNFEVIESAEGLGTYGDEDVDGDGFDDIVHLEKGTWSMSSGPASFFEPHYPFAPGEHS